jgi:hypothetical protein
LVEELGITLNFIKKTTISIVKPVPHVIVIFYSKEEMEVGPHPVIEEQSQSVFVLRLMEKEELQQLVVQEQPQSVLASRLVEEEELQQHVSIGQVFFQELF